MRPVAFEPEGAGDIHVRPFGAILDGGLKERRGGDGTSGAGTGAVSDVGHFTFDLVAVKTSPGLVAPPPGRFSVHGATPMTFTLSPSFPIAASAAMTEAAPVMSAFM